MVDVSLIKMFLVLLTAICVAGVNPSCTVRTSVPSSFSSRRKLMLTSETPGVGNVKSVTVLLQPLAAKSLKSVERKILQSLALLKAIMH